MPHHQTPLTPIPPSPGGVEPTNTALLRRMTEETVLLRLVAEVNPLQLLLNKRWVHTIVQVTALAVLAGRRVVLASDSGDGYLHHVMIRTNSSSAILEIITHCPNQVRTAFRRSAADLLMMGALDSHGIDPGVTSYDDVNSSYTIMAHPGLPGFPYVFGLEVAVINGGGGSITINEFELHYMSIETKG